MLCKPTRLLSVIRLVAWTLFCCESGTWATFWAYCCHKWEMHCEVEQCTVLAVAAFCVLVGAIFVSGLSAGGLSGVLLTVF